MVSRNMEDPSRCVVAAIEAWLAEGDGQPGEPMFTLGEKQIRDVFVHVAEFTPFGT